MHNLNISLLSASLRLNSFNTKLAEHCLEINKKMVVRANLIDLKNYDIPYYNGDIEEDNGVPSSIREIRSFFKESDAIVVSTPEYNGQMPGFLKNIVDWLSRKEKNDSELLFDKKVFGLMCATVGRSAGTKVLSNTRDLLSKLGAVVVPQVFGLQVVDDTFNPDGSLDKKSDINRLTHFSEEVIYFASQFKKG